MVNIPVFLCLISSPLLLFYVAYLFNLPEWLGIIGVLLGIILAWITWSILITKWRIWAFTNVRNVHELKREAILSNLIWKDGTSFERTEYRSKKDKIILKQLEEKFKLEDVFEEDLKIPKETIIYQTLFNAILICFLILIIIFVGVFMIYKDENISFYMGFIMLIVGIIGLKDSLKNILDRRPSIIINKKGIQLKGEDFKPWAKIHEEQVITEGYGSSSKNFLIFCDDNYNYTKIEINNFNTTISKLENLLRTYRIRYNKNKV